MKLQRASAYGVAGLCCAAASFALLWGAWLFTRDLTQPRGGDGTGLFLGPAAMALGALFAAGGIAVVRTRVTVARRAGTTFAMIGMVVVAPLATGALAGTQVRGGGATYPPLGSPQDVAAAGGDPGYTVRYPSSWSLFPPSRPDQPPQTVTLTSWPATAPDAPVKANGLKIVIGPLDGEPPLGEAIQVGEGRYPGTIRAMAPAGKAASSVLQVVYEAEGRTWQIVGTFAEPLAPSNPNRPLFVAVVASIRHRRQTA